MAVESGADTYQEAKDIYTARELLGCSEFDSLLHNVEKRYPQLNVDDIITMLTRVSIREQITHAIDGVCIVPWFENCLMEYPHYCEHNDSSEEEDEEEGVRRGRMHAIGE